MGTRPPGCPLVPGHELAATIERIEGSFPGLQEGMRVAVAPNIPCGACYFCQRGEQTACDSLQTIGVHRDGGFAEHLALPAHAVAAGCVFPIPDGVASEEAALIDPASCVVNACELSHVKPGDTVVVLGAGPAGCLSVEVSRAFGADRTILVQRSPKRLEQAAFTRASLFIDSSVGDACRESPARNRRSWSGSRHRGLRLFRGSGAGRPHGCQAWQRQPVRGLAQRKPLPAA